MDTFNVRWIYRLDATVEYASHLHVHANYLFWDEKKTPSKVRMIILKDGRIFVKPHYAWDGCTPKFCLWDIYIGTPEGAIHKDTRKPKTYFGTLLHDALYQFYDNDRPYSRKDGDRIFLMILEKYDFGPRYLYYAAVRVFGGLVRWLVNMRRKNSGTMEIVSDEHPEIQTVLKNPTTKI